MTRLGTVLLGLSIFATGFSGLVSEFLISTVSTYILGNSIEQFSVIIALMMAMMGLAGAVQRWFPERQLVLQFIAVEIALALLGGFAPIAIYAGYGLLDSHFLLVLYAVAAAIGFLIGFELPLVLRINASLGRKLPGNLAVILSLDYVGGFVGAIVWTRFLLRELPLTEISFWIAGLNFGIAVLTFAYFTWPRGEPALAPLRPGYRVGGWLAIAAAAAALLVGFASNRDWNLQLEQRLYDDRIVFSETTRYQRVVITHDPSTGDHRLYLNGNLQLSSLDEAIYHEQLVHPAMSLAAHRGRVLVLGGGDGLAVREVLRHRDVAQVTLVDLDPRMTALAREHPVLRALNGDALADARVTAAAAELVSGEARRPVFMETDRLMPTGEAETVEVARVEIWNVDADRFLDRLSGLWDVVVIDLPDPSSAELAKLYSREFYRKLRTRLAPGAVVALQATSPTHSREAFLCILRTLESAGFAVVPYRDDVPSFGRWGFLLATTGQESSDALLARARRAAGFPDDTRYLTPEVFRSATVFGKGELAARNDEVNTLMRPVLLSLYLHESWLTD